MSDEIFLSVGKFLAGWLFYTFFLWIMVRFQKLTYTFPGLFGSSFVAALVNCIPVVGPYISHTVLLFCLWRCTRAAIAPDLICTVMIAGALMFCTNLYVLGAAMGSIGPHLADARAAVKKQINAPVPTETDGGEAEDEANEDALGDYDSAIAASNRQAIALPLPAATALKILRLKGITVIPSERKL